MEQTQHAAVRVPASPDHARAGRHGAAFPAPRQELALAAAEVGLFDWNIRTGDLSWDDRLCRIFGVDPAAFDARIETFFALLLPDDVPTVRDILAGAVERCGDYLAEYRIRHPDGQIRWIDARGRVLVGADGSAERLIGVAVDATDLHRGREARPGPYEEPRERAHRVQAYTAALAEAATVHEVTEVVARLVVPALGAAGMVISVVESGRMRVIGHTGYPSDTVELLDRIPVDGQAPISIALRSRTPLFVPSLDAYTAAYPEMADVARMTGKAAWAFLPLVASGRGIGTLTISFAEPREFSVQDRSVLLSLAGLLAHCVARARLHDTEHDLATTLQRGLLPGQLPELPQLSRVARYLPATQGIEVGGDWYDVIALPGGGLAVVIGDVQGHNVAAAAVMGQLRHALRAYASEGHDPAAVLARTSRLLWELGTGLFATCCYISLDPAEATARIVRAGHPHPLIRRTDGRVEPLLTRGGLPLGVDPATEYAVTVVPLVRGELLLLFTDGLVETTGGQGDRQDTVRTALATADCTDLDATVERILQPVMSLPQRDDDVAVLLIRWDGDGPEHDREVVPFAIDRSGLRSVPMMRRQLNALLRGWTGTRTAENIVLMASELVANAILHGDGEVRMTAIRQDDRLRIEVTDGGTRPPRLLVTNESAMGGRGLHIVDRLSDRWGSTPHGDGKTVWFEAKLN